MVLGILPLITILCIAVESYDLKYYNRFESMRGCLQYTTSERFNHSHPYFATADFRNPPVESNGMVQFRMGVLGEKNPSIRLAPQEMPYNSTVMHEIALGHCDNKCTKAHRYIRTGPASLTEHKIFNRKATPGLMTNLDPLMFTIIMYNNSGRVTFTRDNESAPFYEFNADGVKPSHKYIGFINWDAKLVFFFDCPLNPTDPCSHCPSSEIVPF